MGRLTTHVLDSAQGKPACGLKVELVCVDGDSFSKLGEFSTNTDGRVEGALLEGEELTAGTYELRFHAGDYLRAEGLALPDPAFLDIVPIRFGVADVNSHYHVPLLLSPFGYTTYRGS
ncbi:5-hydroxyisourate hydrolase [Pseudovibrio axinellae]|uniref:5-hydroxyisourate hydrolase n=1 Tax=Pseudovibrio axinellae TaxID=989403 RepID=A0A165XC03_9HYPH|nr:hydroxyisourate hydrolase [Pseudovibrio axinellae]KZL17558.1 5-hydroxyisourate hydrolase [Pseudovibrio axinellae]SER32766.1 5-hydroxyisourate hydrolase [Pseudovibrio axinellae]